MISRKPLIILLACFCISGCKPARPELHKAVLEQDKNKVTELIRQGVDINVKNGVGKTALMEATYFCNTPQFRDMTKFLVANGADVNIEAPGGVTALSIALMFGYEDIINLLLDHKAVPDQQIPHCGGNTTALMEVASSQAPNAVLSASVAESLIEHGAGVW